MPRPVTWLPRLPEIRRSVDRSVRSHFGRRELELVFKIRPRTAGKLLEVLATDGINASHLVSRDALLTFLDQVREAKDVSALLEQKRTRRANLTRVKARHLSVRDVATIAAAALPEHIRLQRGRLTIDFSSGEQLIEGFLAIVGVIEHDPLEFERSFEVQPTEGESPEAADRRFIEAEIERMDQELKAKSPPPERGA